MVQRYYATFWLHISDLVNAWQPKKNPPERSVSCGEESLRLWVRFCGVKMRRNATKWVKPAKRTARGKRLQSAGIALIPNVAEGFEPIAFFLGQDGQVGLALRSLPA